MSGLDDDCVRTRDAPPYVLGELQGRRYESFVRHLRHCEPCAEEVELLQQAADAVPLLASRQAPVLDEERVLEQRPTLAVAAAPGRAAASGGGGGAYSPAGRPLLRPIDGGASAGRAGPADLGSGRRLLKSPLPKPALIGFLALAVLAVATVALSSRAANVRYYRIQAGWSRGGAALQLQGNKLQLLVDDMPRPASGSLYEVWVVKRSDRQLSPTGAWLHLNSIGQARVTVPGDYHDWLAVAVYTEPLNGSATTSSGAVVVGDLRGVS